MKDREEL